MPENSTHCDVTELISVILRVKRRSQNWNGFPGGPWAKTTSWTASLLSYSNTTFEILCIHSFCWQLLKDLFWGFGQEQAGVGDWLTPVAPCGGALSGDHCPWCWRGRGSLNGRQPSVWCWILALMLSIHTWKYTSAFESGSGIRRHQLAPVPRSLCHPDSGWQRLRGTGLSFLLFRCSKWHLTYPTRLSEMCVNTTEKQCICVDSSEPFNTDTPALPAYIMRGTVVTMGFKRRQSNEKIHLTMDMCWVSYH